MPRLINWKGQVFNNCKILEPVDENRTGGSYNWIVKCKCGDNFEVKPSNSK
jgi:hypothetical protein